MCENMDLISIKNKLKAVAKKYTSDSHASGDGVSRRSCRLCSGQQGLTSVYGAERYDRYLYNCFNIKVTPPDSMICERCVRQLMTTKHFKRLVEAAFETVPSECSSLTSTVRLEPETLTIKPPTVRATESKFKMVQRPKLKKVVHEKKIENASSLVKKTNAACSICKQRYPVMLPLSARPADFVCARCNSNQQRSALLRQCNLPSTVLLGRLGEQGDGKKRARATTPLKPEIKKCESATKYHSEPRKYHCSQCTQKFILAQRLAEHINSVHNESLDPFCVVCGKNLKTRANLEKHIKIHTGELHRCDICMKTFKSKPILQSHLISHRKKNLPEPRL